MGCISTNLFRSLRNSYDRLSFSPSRSSVLTNTTNPDHNTQTTNTNEPLKSHFKAMHGHPSVQLVHVGTRTERAKHEQIFDAVRNRDKQLLRTLILEDTSDDVQGSQSLVCVSDVNGVNPVELACLLGYTDEVGLFLEHGCSPNLPTSIGRLVHTVLECIKSQSIGMQEGRLLLQRMCEIGCDVKMNDRKRKCTLLYATELSDPQILQLIIRNDARCYGAKNKDPYSGFTPLHMAAMKGDLECLQILLKYGPVSQLNIVDDSGRTALILALKNMIHDLRYLNMAANPYVVSGPNREKLILHQYNAIAVVETLLLAGADTSIGNPLTCALTLVQLDETRGFKTISTDASPFLSRLNKRCQDSVHAVFSISIASISTEEAKTPLEEEWISPYTGVVRLLMYSGANPTAQEKESWKSMWRDSPSVLNHLIEEITDFWKCYEMMKPPKLLHLCKQTIRCHLAKNLKLHEIDNLYLPSTLKDYLKLRCL